MSMRAEEAARKFQDFKTYHVPQTSLDFGSFERAMRRYEQENGSVHWFSIKKRQNL